MAMVREPLVFLVLSVPPSGSTARRTVENVDNRQEVRDFLVTRRARLTRSRRGSSSMATSAASQPCAARR